MSMNLRKVIRRILIENEIMTQEEYDQTKDLDKVVHAYLHAALWTSELDSNWEPHEFDGDSIKNAVTDCRNFLSKASNEKLLAGLDESDIGYNFWLTRNRQGAGFWDKGLGEIGERLTAISQEFKELNVVAPEPGEDATITIY